MKYKIYSILCILFFLTACTQLKQARQSFDAGNYDQTISLCRQALQQDSTDIQAMKLLAGSYLAKDQLDSSLVWYQQIEQLSPSDAKFVNEKLYVVYTRQGDAFMQQEAFYNAIKAYKDALQRSPEDKTQLKLADAYYNAGQFDKAAEFYQALSQTADSAHVNSMLGKMALAEKDAETCLAKGLELKNKSKFSQALVQFEKALELKPDLKEAKYQLNIVKSMPLYRKGRKSGLWEAIEMLGIAAQMYPERAEPHYHMGLAYNKKDRDEYDNAISEFNLVIAKEPDSELARKSRKKINELEKRRKKINDFLSR